MEFLHILKEKSNKPLVTVHAGCCNTQPNSRESIVAAYNSPADIVEVDVRASLDKQIFLMHDENLDFPSSEKIAMDNLSWKEIQYIVNSRQQDNLLSFDNFCDLIEELDGFILQNQSLKKPFFNLDIKSISVLQAIAIKVRSRKIDNRIIFSGLDEEGIVLAHNYIPDMVYLFNADTFLSEESALQNIEDRIENVCSIALRYGCKGVNLQWTKASKELVRRIHERGLVVTLWTVDKESDMEQVLQFNPDSITTNYPDKLFYLMKKLMQSAELS